MSETANLQIASCLHGRSICYEEFEANGRTSGHEKRGLRFQKVFTIRNYRATIGSTEPRVTYDQSILKNIEKFVEGHALQPLVKPLMSFRGIQILIATVIAAVGESIHEKRLIRPFGNFRILTRFGIEPDARFVEQIFPRRIMSCGFDPRNNSLFKSCSSPPTPLAAIVN